MKKTKLLMPILSVGAVLATVAPMVTMTACSKSAFTITKVENEEGEHRNQNFKFQLKWRNFNPEDEKHQYHIDIEPEKIKWDYAVQAVSFDNGGVFNDDKIIDGNLQLYRDLSKDDSVRVWFSFNIIDKNAKIHIKNQKIFITCKFKSE